MVAVLGIDAPLVGAKAAHYYFSCLRCSRFPKQGKAAVFKRQRFLDPEFLGLGPVLLSARVLRTAVFGALFFGPGF